MGVGGWASRSARWPGLRRCGAGRGADRCRRLPKALSEAEREGCQAGQGGEGASLACAQLGQVAQKRGGLALPPAPSCPLRLLGGAGPDALDRAEARGFSGQFRRGGEQRGQPREDFGVLFLEAQDRGGEFFGDGLGQPRDLPRGLGRKHGLELLATRDPCRQFGLRGAGCGRRLGPVGRAKLGEHPRVDPVGFSPLAAAPRKVAHLARVDEGEGDLRSMERGHDGALPPAGGLADHQHRSAHRAQKGDQRRAARRIMGEGQGLALEVEIEGGFGDVESGVDEGWDHGGNKAQPCGCELNWLRQRFEFKNPKAGKFALPDGLNGPRGGNELFPTRCGAEQPAPQHGVLQTFP